MMIQTQTYQRLAYAGTLPFIACASLIALDLPTAAGIDYLSDALSSYGLLIVSFMSGIHWGTYLYKHEQCPLNLLIISNLITLSCWLCFVSGQTPLILSSQLCAFLVLLYVDFVLQKNQIISKDYFNTRRYVTAIVISMLGLTLLSH